MMPPPVPAAKQSKIPVWVWILTVAGVLFMVALYSALFWGFNKVQDLAKADLSKHNPEFEMLYFAKDGQIKVKHKPSGREFLVQPPRGGNKINLREIATVKTKPLPAWIQLKDASPNGDEASWDRAGDNGMLREALEDLFLDHDFEMLTESTNILTACNAKQLRCLVISYANLEGEGNRSRYVAELYSAP